LLLAAACALVAVPYFYNRLDEEIRRGLETRLAEHYSNLSVTVRSAQLVKGEGIEIRGLSIFEPGAAGPQAELLYLDEVFIYCGTDWQELLQGKLDVSQIVVRRPTLRMTRRPGDTWSAASLLPLPKFSERPPEAVIESGVIEIFDPLKNPSATLTLRDANLKVSPQKNAMPMPGGDMPLRLQGHMTSDHARQLEIDAIVDPSGAAWRMSGTVEGLEVSPELKRSLPWGQTSRIAGLEALRAQAVGRFQVAYEKGAKPPLSFDVVGELSRGRLDDPRLPYPLTDLRAKFRCNQQGSTIEELTARSGQATLRLSCQRTGYTDTSPMRLHAEARHMVMDGKLLDILPPNWQQQWRHFLPAGEVDLDVDLAFDGRVWRPDVTARCLNVGFTHHKFPYRLERGRGTVELHGDQLKINLAALGDSAEVRVVAEMQAKEESPVGWIDIRAENVRLDEKFLAALPDGGRSFVRSLNPFGTINVSYLFKRTAESVAETHQDLVVNLNGCSIKFDKFPYPLDNIRGTLKMQDQRWTFANLEGSNGTGHVLCGGHMASTPRGCEFVVRFEGANILLEEELRDALSPSAQQFWNDMKPRGTVNLRTEVRNTPGDPNLHVWVRVQPLDDSVSIEPQYFPYRLEKLRGTFEFNDGHITLADVKAEHARTALSARGACDIRPGAGWHLHLDALTVDRVRADRDLVAAVPERLKKMLAELRLTGPMNLRGSVDFDSRGEPGVPLTSDWNIDVDFQQCSMNCGMLLQNVNGGANLVGDFDGQQFRCQGELNLESVTCRDFQLTQVMGPIWIDDARLLLGFWADRHRQVTPERHLTGKLFGGTVVSDGWAVFGLKPGYSLEANLVRADLARWAQEAMPGRQQLSGEIFANVQLRGRSFSVNDLAGRGNIQLRNADIYELPLMVSLLKVLSVRPPDTTAFTKSDIEFRIEAEHVYVEDIEFAGDAISLVGSGEIGFNKQLRLTFHPIVGRNEGRMPLLRDVLGGASQQILLIHAEGTVDQPSLRREAFPGVSQALQYLQAEFQSRDSPVRRSIIQSSQPSTSPKTANAVERREPMSPK
jgi:hypothetical protein